MFLLLVYLAIAIGVSFLCSMLEAVLLSVPRSHIAVMAGKGSKNGKRLEKMKKDVDKPLAAILTLNTFAHTLGAAGVGAQAASVWNDNVVGLVSVVVTILVLVFSEIIPKTLGAAHAKTLSAPVAFTIHWLIILLYPVVIACNGISRLISGGSAHGPVLSREEVSTMADIALKEGVIDESEATVVYSLPGNKMVKEIVKEETPRFTRIPIIGESLDDTRGVVHRRELYDAMSQGNGDSQLEDLARPIHAVPESAPLPKVLSEFLKRREHLFLVVDEFGGSVGIVTLEDVIESLLGVEIIDETDPVADMQKLAKQLSQNRIDEQAR